MYRRAVLTNRFYGAVIVGWMTLLVLLTVFLVLTLESTWAADYVTRSGRGPVACAACYLELYPPAAALLVWCLGVLEIGALKASGDLIGGPTLGQLFTSVGLGAGLVTLAHVGVIRCWHPAARCAVYLALVGLGAAWVVWVS